MVNLVDAGSRPRGFNVCSDKTKEVISSCLYFSRDPVPTIRTRSRTDESCILVQLVLQSVDILSTCHAEFIHITPGNGWCMHRHGAPASPPQVNACHRGNTCKFSHDPQQAMAWMREVMQSGCSHLLQVSRGPGNLCSQKHGTMWVIANECA